MPHFTRRSNAARRQAPSPRRCRSRVVSSAGWPCSRPASVCFRPVAARALTPVRGRTLPKARRFAKSWKPPAADPPPKKRNRPRAAPAGWATLSGTFKFDGVAPKPAPIVADKDPEVCGKHPLFDESVDVGPSGGLANVGHLGPHAQSRRQSEVRRPMPSVKWCSTTKTAASSRTSC